VDVLNARVIVIISTHLSSYCYFVLQ